MPVSHGYLPRWSLIGSKRSARPMGDRGTACRARAVRQRRYKAARIRQIRSGGAQAEGRWNRCVSVPTVPQRLLTIGNRPGTDRVVHRTFLIHGLHSTTRCRAGASLAAKRACCRRLPLVPGQAYGGRKDAPRRESPEGNGSRSVAIRSRMAFLVRARIVFEANRWLPTTNQLVICSSSGPTSAHSRTSEGALDMRIPTARFEPVDRSSAVRHNTSIVILSEFKRHATGCLPMCRR